MIQQTGRLQSPIRREDLESRKKRLLDRAAVERAQFAQARTELGAKFASLNTSGNGCCAGLCGQRAGLAVPWNGIQSWESSFPSYGQLQRARHFYTGWSGQNPFYSSAFSALRFGKGCIYCARPKRTVQDKHSLFTFLPSIAQLCQR